MNKKMLLVCVTVLLVIIVATVIVVFALSISSREIDDSHPLLDLLDGVTMLEDYQLSQTSFYEGRELRRALNNLPMSSDLLRLRPAMTPTEERTLFVFSEGLTHLYALVDFTIVNNSLVIHTIQFDTRRGTTLTNAFIDDFNNSDNFDFRISIDDFRLVIFNGRPPDGSLGICDTWFPLPDSAVSLTFEQQEYVYEAFRDFTCLNTGFWASHRQE